MKEISAQEVESLKDKFFDGLIISDDKIRQFNDYSTLLSMFMTQVATKEAVKTMSDMLKTEQEQ